MRLAAPIAMLFLLVSGCCSAQQIDPQAPPVFYTKGTAWSEWKPIAQYPHLSLRGACGDDTQVNGVAMFTTYNQIRNGYPYPIAMVWGVEGYRPDLRINKIIGWMLEYVQPGEIAQSIEAVAGKCSHTDTIYVRVKCVARQGNEDAVCFKDSDGNPIPERTDQFRSLPSGSASSSAAFPGKGFVTYGVCPLVGFHKNVVLTRSFTTKCAHRVRDIETFGDTSDECTNPIDEAFGKFIAGQGLDSWLGLNAEQSAQQAHTSNCALFINLDKAETYFQSITKNYQQYTIKVVDWSPK
jgi:hypothetical protein